MKHPPANLVWVLVAILVLMGWLLLLRLPSSNAAAVRAVADTRQSLRDQGFKTDLADFDFSTTPELRAREAVLKTTDPDFRSASFPEHPNLLQPVGNDSAMVVWKLDSLPKQNRSSYNANDQLSWGKFRNAINQNQSRYDLACAAILSGPIKFNLDARGGFAVRLPHLSVMKNLTQTFGDRTVLALHDGNPAGAWTNLLAATRLVTAYEPEPVEISHLVRFADMSLAFNATWQALQTNGWTDAQLARLQAEWESANFFTNLPETAAFQRASAVAMCESDRQRSIATGLTFAEFCKMAFQNPMELWWMLNGYWSRLAYSLHGSYEDQQALLLFYRDREVELRNAIQATNWAQMRQLPGVTNRIFFRSKYPSPIQAMVNLHEMNTAFLKFNSSFLGRAAEAEARRRIIITALALERYHGKFGSYPATLAALTPDFLKTPLPDFMDGQPLRYRLADNGHFLLYSVGLDCVDNGGIILTREQRIRARDDDYFRQATPQADIVWPLPASEAAIQAMLQQQEKVKGLRSQQLLETASAEDWKQSLVRQARVEKILAAKWSPDAGKPSYQGRPLDEVLRNASVTGTNRLSLAELLTPRQIITGQEPEDLTFEFPISYDVVTNLGALVLLVDAEMNLPEIPDTGARVQDSSRATNGDCLLVWHTIFDPPGQHAVQVKLMHTDWREDDYCGRGPAISVVTTNLCQFSLDSSTYDVELGATFHARLPEPNGSFSIECVTTNGAHLKTLSGSTTNGEFNVLWNLVDDHGHRLNGETFNSIVHLALPDSGRTQTLRGP